MMMYSQDYDEMLMNYPAAIAGGYLWNVNFSSYLKSAQVQICPDANNVTTNASGQGTNFTSWTGFQAICSYGYNGYLYCDSVSGSICNISQETNPANTSAMSDAVWVDNWGSTAVPPQCPTDPSYDLVNGVPNLSSGPALGRICINRHNMGINVCFADGHAKYLQLSKLNGPNIQYVP
jgi:prepilin-type processing-associated H-X9-DG protein